MAQLYDIWVVHHIEHEILNQGRVNVGTPSATAQH